MRLIFWVALLSCALACGLAAAHTRSESHSVWEINGPHLDLVMTFGDMEAARLATGSALPDDHAMEAYLTARVYPLSGGKRCALVPPAERLSAAPGYRKYDFTFLCPQATDLAIESHAFLDVAPSHTNFAQVQDMDAGSFTEQLLTADNSVVQVKGGPANVLQSASFPDYIGMGIMHIFTGVDHQSFLLGLLLISRRFRDLVFVVTGFTLGHSLTLALSVTGILRPHAEYIDALVALTIILIGLENVAVTTRHPSLIAAIIAASLGALAVAQWIGLGGLPGMLLAGAGLFAGSYLIFSSRVQDAARWRLLITLIFGLIHGFGFASDLLQLQIPPLRMAQLLVGFNLGVEIGQLTLVTGISGLLLLLTRWRLALPRPIVADIVSAFLVGIGMYWFISRSYA